MVGERISLSDYIPDRSPNYSFAMKLIHELSDVVAQSPEQQVRTDALAAIGQISSWLGACKLPEAEFRALFDNLTAKHPELGRMTDLLKCEHLFDN